MKRVVSTAAALVIGDELLSGKVGEANIAELARTLRGIGISLQRAVLVGDDAQQIVSELNRLRAMFDVVVTSGGVGPTHDDITLEAVATAFGVPAISDPGLCQMLERVYGDRLTESHLRMALVPQGATLVSTDDVKWPTVVIDNVWIMPGIPEAFRSKLPVLKNSLRGPVEFFSRAAYTQLDEGQLQRELDATIARFPSVSVGSYPKWFDAHYRTKITFDGHAKEVVDSALEFFKTLLPPNEPRRVE